MSTRAELVSAVRDYLNRPNMPASTFGWLFPAVEGQLNRELMDHPRNHVRANWTIPTEDSLGDPYPDETTHEVLLPTNCARVRRLMAEDGATEFPQYPTTIEPTTGYHDRGNALWVFPAQDRGTTLYLDYIAFLEPLALDDDENWVSTYFSDLYLYGLLKEAAVFLKDDQRLSLWQSEFARRVAEVSLQGWNQNMGDAPSVRIK